jgi:hypothetical protein
MSLQPSSHPKPGEALKQGLDFVLVSYYEDDCNGLQPDWQAVLSRLHALFPQALIGFGEIETRRAARRKRR